MRGAEERRRDDDSISGTFLKSASRPLATQSLQRHSEASVMFCEFFFSPSGVVGLEPMLMTYLRRQLAKPRLWRIVCELQVGNVSAQTLKSEACI